jgi:hypothetical protein
VGVQFGVGAPELARAVVAIVDKSNQILQAWPLLVTDRRARSA